MADEIVDTIAQYDLDEDFPPYANDQNKELNQIVREKVRLVAQLGLEIEEHQERLKILSEHLKSVKMELVHTQSLVDTKNKEIETEEHMKQITERQSGRLKNEIEKLEQRIADQQDRLNNIQNMIFKANERMDQFKLEMNWNQEELEQWALAARQKEEDNLTLEKYRRADEAKIKELTLQIEKLTVEVGSKSKQLEQEVTETQAAQIELDKTAEEFKRLHQERHQLYLQWQETVENSRRRDELINQTGEDFGKLKDELDLKKSTLEQYQQRLNREKENNKNTQTEIVGQERLLAKLREVFQRQKDEKESLSGEVAILRNQLSAFATELNNKRGIVAATNTVLADRMQRLDAAKKKFAANKERLTKEETAQEQVKQVNQMAEQGFKEAEKMKEEVEKESRLEKAELFKQSQILFKLRAEQANLIGDISGTLSASRNLQANITKLEHEKTRQQELIYNANYQIQLMERNVARAQGERSQEETEKLKKDIADQEAKRKEYKSNLTQLVNSNKQLQDEKRIIERTIEKLNHQKQSLDTQIHELTLGNSMAAVDKSKVEQRKEKTLVQHDIMKLEIKRLRDTVNNGADKVYGLENRKYQLEMSMEEREKEIKVHRDILESEKQAAEEERHKLAVELQLRQQKVKNLRIKFEGLVQRNKSSSGDVEADGEHTQAYFVIKAAQEREELQRFGDELDGKIRKSEKEIKALSNTLDHLKVRNRHYRDKFKEGADGADLERKQILEDQCRHASETLFKKRRELQNLQQTFDSGSRDLMQIRNDKNQLFAKRDEVNNQYSALDQELAQLITKIQNQSRAHDAKLNNVKAVRGADFEQSSTYMQILAEVEATKHQHLMNALSTLVNDPVISQELTDLVKEIETSLAENQIVIPSRPNSAIQRQDSASSRRSSRQ